MVKSALIKCPSCHGNYPDYDGPTHRYMSSSPGCWHVYGQVLAKEYSDSSYWANHRLTVDAYAVQHPGVESKQSIQSVAVHLISLYLVLERNVPQAFATNAIKELTGFQFNWLTPPKNSGAINAGIVLQAKNADEHNSLVKQWASSVWVSWQDHHAVIKTWAQKVISC